MSKAAPSSPLPSQVWLRNCEKETVEPIEGKLTGKLPEWLNGRLTRNGPGRIEFGDTRINHLFDGTAYIHQFNIIDGKVTYQSRYLNSDTYKKNKKADRIVVSEFGTAAYPDPCKTLLQRFMSAFTPISKAEPTDNCLVNVCYFGDQLYALTETRNLRRIHPETLDVVGEKVSLVNFLSLSLSLSHIYVCVCVCVCAVHLCMTISPSDIRSISRTSTGKKISSIQQAEIVSAIPCQWKMYPSYYHSFGITENYFIFVEQPYVFNLKRFLLNHYMGKPYFSAVEWYPDQKTKFRLVHRKTGEMVKTVYAANAFLTFHHTNAYEKDGQLVIDLASMKDGEAVNALMMKNIENPDFVSEPATMPTHWRFVLPLDVQKAPENTNLITLEGTKCTAYKRPDQTVEVHGQSLSSQYFDLQRINYKYNGKEYQYAYGVEVNPKGSIFSRLVKMDVNSGETTLWHEEGKVVSEPVFVAAPGAIKEDEGVVLSTLLDMNNTRFVALLVLDPVTWTEIARVEFEANGTVTSSFHGLFAATNEKIHMY
ncbi:beta,beta-carotene 15,15'-dioxygenase-like [Penaeus japonicus]|uniref:beta,beta-carotene 15,15'-dioxygenase-like n=1 Tax=Penaeus japonicus TaxID=27405 RepID=UPI001C716C2C|nr:beta,beta-carotene 15,15'-dioxygenase-like [Penaeus japonicus]